MGKKSENEAWEDYGLGLEVAPMTSIHNPLAKLGHTATPPCNGGWKVEPSHVPKTNRKAGRSVSGTSGEPLSLGLILHSIHSETTYSVPTGYLALLMKKCIVSHS